MNWRTIFLLWVFAALVWIGGWFLWSISVDSRKAQLDEGFAPVFVTGSVVANRQDRNLPWWRKYFRIQAQRWSLVPNIAL